MRFPTALLFRFIWSWLYSQSLDTIHASPDRADSKGKDMRCALIWTVLSLALVLGCGRKEVPEQTETQAGTKPDVADVLRKLATQQATTQRADKRQYTDAIAIYKKYLALDPNDAEVYLGLGKAYRELGQYVKAVAAHKKAITIEPDYAEAYYHMGLAYNNRKHYYEAMSAFKKYLAFEPNDAKAYLGLGIAYSGLKQYTDAIAAFKKAIVINPDDASAYHNMGLAYNQLEQYSDSLVAFKKYIALEPAGEHADFARACIGEIEKMGKP